MPRGARPSRRPRCARPARRCRRRRCPRSRPSPTSPRPPRRRRPRSRRKKRRRPLDRDETKMTNPLRNANHPPLPGPFATPPSPDGIVATPAVSRLVHAQVRALLESSPAFHQLPSGRQRALRDDLEKIATYEAALIQDEWASSEKLGQTPVLRETTIASAAEAPAQALAGKPAPKGPAADEFSPRAASQVARITRETLNAIAFPTFVADLIKGTFQAIVNASIQQMEAYGNLLSNVAKTVDQFMADNVSDNKDRKSTRLN